MYLTYFYVIMETSTSWNDLFTSAWYSYYNTAVIFSIAISKKISNYLHWQYLYLYVKNNQNTSRRWELIILALFDILRVVQFHIGNCRITRCALSISSFFLSFSWNCPSYIVHLSNILWMPSLYEKWETLRII